MKQKLICIGEKKKLLKRFAAKKKQKKMDAIQEYCYSLIGIHAATMCSLFGAFFIVVSDKMFLPYGEPNCCEDAENICMNGVCTHFCQLICGLCFLVISLIWVTIDAYLCNGYIALICIPMILMALVAIPYKISKRKVARQNALMN